MGEKTKDQKSEMMKSITKIILCTTFGSVNDTHFHLHTPLYPTPPRPPCPLLQPHRRRQCRSSRRRPRRRCRRRWKQFPRRKISHFLK